MALYCHPDGPEPSCPLCRKAGANPVLAAYLASLPPPGAAKPKKGASATSPLQLRSQCPHFGERLAGPCGAALHRCDLDNVKVTRFGGCKDAQRSCQTCPHHPDSQPPAPITTRHLLYHLYPVSGNGAWQWNVDELCKRLDLFNGLKVVAVATDPPTGRRPDPKGKHAPDRSRMIPGCDTLEDVRAAFGEYADTVEFVPVENDPNLREVASFLPLFERAALYAGPGDAFLYAQAKGTTRPPGHIARRWTAAMIEVLLDHWPAVERSLMNHPITGAFKKYGAGWARSQSASDWHYSGSWFWCRSASLFAKSDWRRIDPFWSGIEPYPSQHFGSESGCVFHEDRVSKMNLYDGAYWNRVVEPLLASFRAENIL